MQNVVAGEDRDTRKVQVIGKIVAMSKQRMTCLTNAAVVA